jgi:hypothetical protein
MSRDYLLLLRFAILNVAALGLLAVAWQPGWVLLVLSNDVTKLSLIIVVVFFIGWCLCVFKVWPCSQQPNAINNHDTQGHRVHWYQQLATSSAPHAHGAVADCLRARLYARISGVRTIVKQLVILGLIGTIVGFIIALSGVNADAISQVDAIGAMASTLLQGMSVALFTALVGAIFHVWLSMCYQVLATGTVNLTNAISERAEAPEFFAEARADF